MIMTQVKQCRKCGETKALTDFYKQSTSKDGVHSYCKTCNNAHAKRWHKENREKYLENQRRYDAEIRERDHIADTVNCHNRRAKKLGLPATLTVEQWQNTLYFFEDGACPLTEEAGGHFEHFIPLSWGHSGTVKGNVYPLQGYLNISMGKTNPFKWVKQRSEDEKDSFNVLAQYLAWYSNMSLTEFERYVNWCEQNPRTAEQIAQDNVKYGEDCSSVELYWISAMVSAIKEAGGL
ncbi:hypothetical protein [Paenibacillus sp. Soil787]|uniref:hypothetical protein n=1 Tax=Paenibacillus sp. Soil787 TaxID=1736411 RepID=UPI000702D2CD|nr:hypothetical protein [Paenibacillus sp. Soil787]KRF10751.1 hypothetical protein ASG93_17625 [Paenibacillus sp. Soil787]